MDIKSRGRRNCEPRVLQYRKHVRLAGRAYIVLAGICFFISALVFAYITDVEATNLPTLHAGIVSLIFGVSFLSAYWFLIRPLAISKIQIFDDHIRIKRNRKTIKIPYAAIKEIKHKVNKNVGGWFTVVLKNKNKYRFTVALQRSEYVLEGIYKARPELLEEAEYFKLRQSLILADHGFGRIQDAVLNNLALLIFSVFGLPAAFIGYLAYVQLNDFIVHDMYWYFTETTMFIFFFMAFVWAISIFRFNIKVDKEAKKRLEQNPNNKKRDLKFEAQAFRPFIYKTTAFTMMFCSFYYVSDFNTSSAFVAKADSKELELQAGKAYSYDVKYNCFDCKYKLVKSDIVRTESGVGRIVGLPNETVALNTVDYSGRYIASTKEQKLPAQSGAVQMEDGKVVMVRDFQIYGKVIKRSVE